MKSLGNQFLFALAAVSGMATVSAAPITPVSQARSVSSSTYAASSEGPLNFDSDSVSAPDFGLFDAQIGVISRSISILLDTQTGYMIGEAYARQYSEVGTHSISASGNAHVSPFASTSSITSGVAYGASSSILDIVFLVNFACAFSLDGFVDTQAIVSGGASFLSVLSSFSLLDVDNGSSLFQTLTTDESFAISGRLQPGKYRLLASSAAASEVAAGANDATAPSTKTVDATSSFDFTFNLTPSQVPDSALGLGGVAFIFGALLAAGSASNCRKGHLSRLLLHCCGLCHLSVRV